MQRSHIMCVLLSEYRPGRIMVYSVRLASSQRGRLRGRRLCDRCDLLSGQKSVTIFFLPLALCSFSPLLFLCRIKQKYRFWTKCSTFLRRRASSSGSDLGTGQPRDDFNWCEPSAGGCCITVSPRPRIGRRGWTITFAKLLQRRACLPKPATLSMLALQDSTCVTAYLHLAPNRLALPAGPTSARDLHQKGRGAGV
ncbi:hypothetical protein B0T25DRAFT_110575 [Lasiosphaeria hispida]|uniref:Uncharacterized protein n=1 Tax=Lasiosphaeria hispida TaxID=260671 RepID=A0AAJ0HQW7_9PEZI|nr:hypothetical protein B0T25DRAFT_110575 [Lasiosphaeria hispida]